MSTFKLKHDKTKQLIQINTLDEKHKKIMNSFQNRRNQLPSKKKKVEFFKKQLNKLENANPSSFTTNDIKKRSELKTKISELENEIYDIENDLSELDYYFRIEDIIMDYYEITEIDDGSLYNENPELSEAQRINKENNITNKNEVDRLDELNKINSCKRKPKRITKRRKRKGNASTQVNILDFLGGKINQPLQEVLTEGDEWTEFTESEIDYSQSVSFENQNNIDDTQNLNNNDDPTNDINNDTTNNNIINTNNNMENKIKNKSELLDQYLMLVDPEYLCEKKKQKGKFIKCLNCDIEKTLIHSEGIFVCQNCGEVEIVIVDSEKPNYKEAITDTKPGYPYLVGKKNGLLWLYEYSILIQLVFQLKGQPLVM